jgi:thiol-disulfide isomerase/thioredoxin
MKKILAFSFLFLAGYFTAHSQTINSKQGSTIPVFKILLTNNKYYETKDIPRDKPFILVYFAPDCDHCIVLMDALFKKIDQLSKASIVLASFKSPQEVNAFAKKYHTTKYPNIKVGTEGLSYVLRDYYKLEKTPFIAVYDKKGNLAFSYRNETPVDELITRFKKLK